MANLSTHIADHVATITLTRADMRNAFNDEVIADITQAFKQLGQAPEVRAIVLAAEGKAFCAGADLNWMRKMADYTHAENSADAAKLADMLHTIYTCPKPTVARIQGDVYAGGMGLVAACDMAVAVEGSHFCLSEVKLGLIPATIAPYVIRALGARASHRYFLTAERFDAQEALRLGFIHALVAQDTSADPSSTLQALDLKVAEITKALVQAGPQAVKAAKQLVLDVAQVAITPALIAQTVEGIAQIRASEEGKEGVQSFLQKRTPNWLA
ncbi:enoyl-CoA hydratase/isomerase family protein [Lampropedia aestuarii]|uniref:Enoyl-CoA hydratase/isomerase family protein n=1 Tax=Lampropedia aestuarii TaxID=2562762 RepID=A0A4S5BP86_9BURK|nr:enoyl-CoA hydratase/isomerase family protein [Lampropedia aestuarii]THJ34270.1 enoyl-CoA hydratase/isomerase family protein [Lampropedia aestuarii]